MPKYRISMTYGSLFHEIEADGYKFDGKEWAVYYNNKPTGGTKELLRVKIEHIGSVETS